jgi:hypothetical protein
MSIQLSDLLQNLYGVKSFPQVNKKASSVGTSVIEIMSSNPNRVSFLIVNLSVNNLYISPQNDVSSTKGIYIAPSGGAITLQWDKDFELVSQPFFAVASGAASSIFVLENISN